VPPAEHISTEEYDFLVDIGGADELIRRINFERDALGGLKGGELVKWSAVAPRIRGRAHPHADPLCVAGTCATPAAPPGSLRSLTWRRST